MTYKTGCNAFVLSLKSQYDVCQSHVRAPTMCFSHFPAVSRRPFRHPAADIQIAMIAGSNLLLSSNERFFTRVLYVFTVCTE